MYQPRTYRHWVKGKDLVAFKVMVEETDLYVRAAANLKSKTLKLVVKYREALKKYIERYPLFLTTLEPFPVGDDAPAIARAMADSTARVGVGPMASVAGAIADFVGRDLLEFSPEVIIENGGDIFLRSLKPRLVGIYAGESPLSGKIGLELDDKEDPQGISTSSGTVGHSLSFGKADAVVVVADSATLSDAAATAIGNMIKEPEDIPAGIKFAEGVAGLKGVVIIQGEHMGVWGDIKLRETQVDRAGE